MINIKINQMYKNSTAYFQILEFIPNALYSIFKVKNIQTNEITNHLVGGTFFISLQELTPEDKIKLL